MRLSILFLLIAFGISSLSAQEKQNEKVLLDGKEYILYTVEEGETIFSICDSFKIENKALIAENSELLFGLKPGQIVKIPLPKEFKPEELVKHKVKRRQTIFSIAKSYNVKLEDIYRLNPDAKNGIKNGDILRIPLIQEQTNIKAVVEEEKPTMTELPSFIETPSTDLDSGSVNYFYHRIDAAETIFSLQKEYGVSKDTLLNLNPFLMMGLKPGMSVKLPDYALPKIKSIPQNQDFFLIDTISNGVSLFDLAVKHNTSIEELEEINQQLKYREPIEGEVLWIPNRTILVKKFDEETGDSILTEPDYLVDQQISNINKACAEDSSKLEKQYQVALMLPLFLEANDTINHVPLTVEELKADSAFMSTYVPGTEIPKDSFRIRENEIIDPRSESFVHLYEGVLLAVDKLRQQGMNVALHVFDTNRSQEVVDSLIQLDVFREMDLIIGPVFPNLQESVSAFSAKNRIPMVSPLSGGGNYENTNPYFFKLNPEKEYLIEETADYITENYFDKNFVIFDIAEYAHLPEAKLVELCRDKLFSTGYYQKEGQPLFYDYDFEKEGYWGLQRILSKDRENVVIIPAVAEGQVSTAVTNLNSLTEEFDITLIGLSRFKSYKSIQPEYFHNTKLKYFSHYFLDYNSLKVNQFIATFKENFSTEPNEFSFQGYDVAYYFMSALFKYGKEFKDCLTNYHIELNQLNLDLQKVSPFSGYMNYGLFLVDYDKEFNINNAGKAGVQNLLMPIR